jgi:hypothetical protein
MQGRQVSLIASFTSILCNLDGQEGDFTSEIGLADGGEVRMGQHAKHSGTTHAFALFECILFAEYNDRYR